MSDGGISLRLPGAQDARAIVGYAGLAGGLDDGWLPLAPPVSAHRARWIIEDWLGGWAGLPSHNGPALMVSPDGTLDLVGMVGLGPRGCGVVEMVYGVAPMWRGQGVARRALRLAADWLTSVSDVDEVELRIGSRHLDSQRVAVGAGFVLRGTVRDVVPRTGEIWDDLRFIFAPGG